MTFKVKNIRNRFALSLLYLKKEHSFPSNVFPSLVHIELTNVCNLKCKMCPLPYMKREKGYMDIDLFKKIVFELSKSPVETVALSLFGESMLHKEFSEFLRIAKSAGLNIFLSVNGLKLSEELSRAIIDNSLDLLIVSYDSSDSELFKDIRGGGI